MGIDSNASNETVSNLPNIPAWHGEFGLKVRFWVPQVHAACLKEDVVVHCEPGEEALYPAAACWVVEDGPADHRERAALGRPPKLHAGEQRFIPSPHIWQSAVPSAPYVICPRHMRYGTAKNWPHWPLLARSLDCIAAGSPDGSDRRVEKHCPVTWNHPRVLDATIQAIRQARLVIATDAGLAHLAVLCGAPLLLVTYRGRVAPGPVISSKGHVVAADYWPVRLKEYYDAANHMRSPIQVIDGWENPRRVLRVARVMGVAQNGA